MKRWILLALLLALLGAAAPAETLVAFVDGEDPESASFGLLLREDGTLLTPEGAFGYIYCLSPDGTPEDERLYSAEAARLVMDDERRAMVEENDYYYYPSRRALLDASGRALTGFDYSYLVWACPGQVIFSSASNGLCGILDGDGHELLPAEFVNIVPAGDGGWLALAPAEGASDSDDPLPLLRIEPDGSRREVGWHIPDSGLGDFSEGLCALNDVAEIDGRALYVDAQGALAFEGRFDYAEPFRGCLAKVWQGDGTGLIDRQGGIVVEPGPGELIAERTLRGTLYLAWRDDQVQVYDSLDGALLYRLSMDGQDGFITTANPAMLCARGDSGTTFYALDGAPLARFPSELYASADFSEGCEEVPGRLIVSHGEWPGEVCNLVTPDGAQTGGDFQRLTGIHWADGHGLYAAESWQIVRDEDGDPMPNWRSYRFGLCDENGVMLLDCVYSRLEALSADRFWVTQGSRSGMIGPDGTWYYTFDAYQNLMD